MTIRAIVERKLFLRLLSFLVLMYGLFAIDRVNISFAALQMNTALGLSPQVYGFGAGIYSVSMLLFQVPVVLLMRRLGGRRGFAITLIIWGLVSAGTAFVWDKWSFFAVRFLLGMAEAGFAVFVVYYISEWFPVNSRARAISVSIMAVPATMAVASPLSGWILSTAPLAGLDGWQRIFIFEGLPSVLVGCAAFFYLVDLPAAAAWLTAEERAWLTGELRRNQAQSEAQGGGQLQSIRQMLHSGSVWAAGIIQFAALVGISGLVYWLPLIVKQVSGASNLQVGFLVTLPWVAMSLGLYLNGAHSDKTQERLWHLVAGLAVSAAGFVLGASASNPTMTLLGLLIGAFGAGATQAVFWTIPLSFLSGAGVAAGLAIINLIGNSAGIGTPYLIGLIRDKTGTFDGALWMLAGFYLLAMFILIARFRKRATGKKLRVTSKAA